MRSRAGGFIITRVATHSLGPGLGAAATPSAGGEYAAARPSWRTLQEA